MSRGAVTVHVVFALVRKGRLIVSAPTDLPEGAVVALMPISDLPQLADRAHEVPRVVEEYGEDARDALSTTAPFTQDDRDWVVAHCTSLPEIEQATLRLMALRHGGSAVRGARSCRRRR